MSLSVGHAQDACNETTLHANPKHVMHAAQCGVRGHQERGERGVKGDAVENGCLLSVQIRDC